MLRLLGVTMLSNIISFFKRENPPPPSNIDDLLTQIKTLTPEEKQIIQNALQEEQITTETSVVQPVQEQDPNYEYDKTVYKRTRD